jgi:hypothetical protein
MARKREDPTMTQRKKGSIFHLHNEDRRFGAPIDITGVIHDDMPLGDEPVVEAEELEELEALLIK